MKRVMWLIGLAVAVSLVGLPCVFLFSGCGSTGENVTAPEIGPTSADYMAWCQEHGINVVTGQKFPEPGAGEPPSTAVTEALKISEVASAHQGAGDEWLRWPATHPLKATLKGGKLYLESTALKAWPIKDKIVGSCWFVVKRNGKWRAYNWDYIRASGDPRGVPWRTSTPASHETVIPGEEWYVTVTGLYRDKRRNVSERTVIARVQ